MLFSFDLNLLLHVFFSPSILSGLFHFLPSLSSILPLSLFITSFDILNASVIHHLMHFAGRGRLPGDRVTRKTDIIDHPLVAAQGYNLLAVVGVSRGM